MRRLVLLLALAACRETSSATDASIDGDGFPYPPPRTDAFARLGGPDTIEIAAWNIENFPDTSATPARVADLITSLDLDIVVVEEIASETAWKELLDRLREHDGVLSEHRYTPTEYQKIGVIYRTSLVTPTSVGLAFVENTYQFPRPPLVATVTFDDGVHRALGLTLVGVHLKAGVTTEDSARRAAAFEALRDWVHERLLTDNVEHRIVIAGDYNEVITDPEGMANFAPFLSEPDVFTIHTKAAAEAGAITFVPSSVMLDHITSTSALTVDLPEWRLEIPRLHTLPMYVSQVSDHLPVVLVANLPPR